MIISHLSISFCDSITGLLKTFCTYYSHFYLFHQCTIITWLERYSDLCEPPHGLLTWVNLTLRRRNASELCDDTVLVAHNKLVVCTDNRSSTGVPQSTVWGSARNQRIYNYIKDTKLWNSINNSKYHSKHTKYSPISPKI